MIVCVVNFYGNGSQNFKENSNIWTQTKSSLNGMNDCNIMYTKCIKNLFCCLMYYIFSLLKTHKMLFQHYNIC